MGRPDQGERGNGGLMRMTDDGRQKTNAKATFLTSDL
jgi:hypothetical protein